MVSARTWKRSGRRSKRKPIRTRSYPDPIPNGINNELFKVRKRKKFYVELVDYILNCRSHSRRAWFRRNCRNGRSDCQNIVRRLHRAVPGLIDCRSQECLIVALKAKISNIRWDLRFRCLCTLLPSVLKHAKSCNHAFHKERGEATLWRLRYFLLHVVGLFCFDPLSERLPEFVLDPELDRERLSEFPRLLRLPEPAAL